MGTITEITLIMSNSIPRLFLLSFLFFTLTIVNAKTITVSKKGKIKSITEALKIANQGDSIEVKSGTYYENTLILSQSITIFTTEKATINSKGSTNDVFIVKADNVSIKGFRIVNVGVTFMRESAAIRLVSCENARVENNQIDSCYFGIYVEYSKNSIISHNKIHGSFKDEASAGNAIHVWKGTSLTISDNLTTGHRDGIYFEFVNGSRIEKNVSQFNLRYGLHFMFSNDNTYESNHFQDNGAGVAVMFSHNIIMRNNKFVHNWGGAAYGLLLKEISDGTIEGNHFLENTIGIMAEGANRLNVINNEFKLNGTAMDIKGNCMDNKFEKNNFVANTFEVVTNTKSNSNHYSKNYWSNYSGYDRNRDGFGDVAYRPVSLFAKVTNEIPSATFLLHSPFIGLMVMTEKIFPQFIPKTLVDEMPKMKPYDFD